MARLSDVQIAQAAAGAGFSGDSLVTAVSVALAESGGDAGNTTGDGGTSYGLWQIHWTVHPQFDPGQLTDPNYNAAAAFAISGGGTNWHPWTTWKTGAFRKYLSRAQNADASLAPSTNYDDASGKQWAASPVIGTQSFFPENIGIPGVVGIAVAALVLIWIFDL